MNEEAKYEDAAIGFPCTDCGSQMAFDPARGKLFCRYCESEREIASKEIEAPEYVYYPAEDRYDAPKWEEKGARTLLCPSCGADTLISAAAMTATCPFCGSHYVTEAPADESLILPETMMPFRLSSEEAVTRFRAWVKKRWLAPRAFLAARHTLTPQGIYLPFWTFDAALETDYHGYGGRRRVVHYTVRVNGKTQHRTRTVTDWYPIQGREFLSFDNIPCAATRRFTPDLLKKLGPYSMTVLHVYDPAYLAGFFAERYSVGLGEGFAQVRSVMEQRMQRHIEAACRYDTYRDMHYTHHYREVRFKHILLPLWCASYRYREKEYPLLINGETGVVAGKSPLSAWKIALLVAGSILAAGLFVLAVLALGGELG